jgi:hypothetical protein
MAATKKTWFLAYLIVALLAFSPGLYCQVSRGDDHRDSYGPLGRLNSECKSYGSRDKH